MQTTKKVLVWRLCFNPIGHSCFSPDWLFVTIVQTLLEVKHCILSTTCYLKGLTRFRIKKKLEVNRLNPQLHSIDTVKHFLQFFNRLSNTLFEIFIFCPEIQLWFPEKIVDFFGGWKTRENVVALGFLAVDNFDFTRKIVKKIWGEKLMKLNFWTKIWLFD